MYMELCKKWLDTVARSKFGKLSPREELIAAEFAAWLNQKSAQQKYEADMANMLPDSIKEALNSGDGVYRP